MRGSALRTGAPFGGGCLQRYQPLAESWAAATSAHALSHRDSQEGSAISRDHLKALHGRIRIELSPSRRRSGRSQLNAAPSGGINPDGQVSGRAFPADLTPEQRNLRVACTPWGGRRFFVIRWSRPKFCVMNQAVRGSRSDPSFRPRRAAWPTARHRLRPGQRRARETASQSRCGPIGMPIRAGCS